MITIQTQLSKTIAVSYDTVGIQSKVGKLNGNSIVLIDPSYKTKKGLIAGGPGLQNFFQGLILAGALFGAAVATIAVGITTKNLKQTAATAGISISIISVLAFFAFNK